MFIKEAILKSNGLRYSISDELAIRRVNLGDQFIYQSADGQIIDDSDRIGWYEALAVPPVYRDVHYCSDNKGHLQASGIDTTGSTQYFYHPQWEVLREQYKFKRLLQIGERLPGIRRKVREDLKGNRGDKYFVLAAITRVLDNTGLRIGNQISKEENNTYGVSTLEKEHLHIENSGDFTLEFTGKGGVEIEREIVNSGVKNVLETFYERPGDLLFQYQKEGAMHAISPAQINYYISSISRMDMTAKEFRTWRASALFVKFWTRSGGDQKTLGDLLAEVCALIGNTPATLRNSYIHPTLAEKKKDQNFQINDVKGIAKKGLRKAERVMLAMLDETTIDK
ncbi:MAG: hypothetical protein AAFO69_03685 [Bacteroidota bacterium]